MDVLPTITSVDVQRRNATVAVLPIGSYEQHGEFLPLATDTLVACAVAQAITQAYPSVQLLPPITISCSHEHAAWAGTVSISAATLYAMINDIAASLDRAGVAHLVLVSGHGGNYVLSNVVQEANVVRRRMALFPTSADWAEARAAAAMDTDSHSDMHAGELETSLLLHAHPEAVKPGYESADHVHNDRRHLLVGGMAAYTTTGVIGQPSAATAEKGKALLDRLASGFSAHLEQLVNAAR